MKGLGNKTYELKEVTFVNKVANKNTQISDDVKRLYITSDDMNELKDVINTNALVLEAHGTDLVNASETLSTSFDVVTSKLLELSGKFNIESDTIITLNQRLGELSGNIIDLSGTVEEFEYSPELMSNLEEISGKLMNLSSSVEYLYEKIGASNDFEALETAVNQILNSLS